MQTADCSVMFVLIDGALRGSGLTFVFPYTLGLTIPFGNYT